MATITLTIPDAMLARVRSALCAEAGLVETNQNAKEAVIRYIKQIVQAHEYAAAVRVQPPVEMPVVDQLVT